MRVIIVLFLVATSGCSSMSEREKAFHVMHLIDVAQTYQIAKSDCHHEAGVAQLFIGTYPDESSVLIWGVASSIIYHYAEKRLPDTIMDMNFVLKVGVVENNFEEGLSPSGSVCL